MENQIYQGIKLYALSLEDSIQDYEIICELLIAAGFDLDISRVEKEKDFESLLQKNPYDIIISDFKLPGFDAFGALRMARKICPDVPFICVSGSIGDELAVELLKKGAVDYILKDRMERLPSAVQRAIEEAFEKNNRKKAEKALKESEERLRDIIFSSSDWVWEVDEHGRYIYSSERDIELLGISSEEIIGKTPFDFMPANEAERVAAIFMEIAANKKPIKDLENWIIGKNGRNICLLTNGLPIIDQEGQLKGYRGIDKNITERKQAEQELIKAKENAEASDRLKTSFMNNISHEIRTPLNGILGFGKILMEPDYSAEEKADYFKIFNNSSTRLLNTITNIMDISLLTSGNQEVHPKEFQIDNLIKDIYGKFKILCQEKNLDLSIEKENIENGFRISTDENLINKILSNLIDNAIKFTPSGFITIGFEKKENELHVFVKDSGIGISAENRNQIFDNFMQEDNTFTRKYQGTGIGLSLAKGLVELLGGKIGLDSEKGKGSTFYFTIPIE